MKKTTITPKSTLEEAYRDYEGIREWSDNTLKGYRKNIRDISEHMIKSGLEPTLENISYEYALTWKKDHYGTSSPNTLKQQQSTVSSLFRHLNSSGIIQGNPFSTIQFKDYTGDNYLSKDLNIMEIYQVYKAAHELHAQGVHVLAPILLDMYTGFRSTNLVTLQVRSFLKEEGGIQIIFSKKDDRGEENKEATVPNSKNRECFLPLPPKVQAFFTEYTHNMNPEDSLLYGLRGKPLANKQMNYITNKICAHLGWLIEDTDSISSPDITEKETDTKNKKSLLKTDKFFTPHGLRYSIATMFHEMGVTDNGIRVLLLHSKSDLGALQRYIRRDIIEVKQIRMAQLLLETVLETALELEDRFSIQMDLEAIYEQLPFAFENQMKNVHYVYHFKEQMIRFTMSKIEQELQQPVVQNSPHMFQAPELIQTAYSGPTSNQGTFQGQGEGHYMPINYIATQPPTGQMPFYSNYPVHGGSYQPPMNPQMRVRTDYYSKK